MKNGVVGVRWGIDSEQFDGGGGVRSKINWGYYWGYQIIIVIFICLKTIC